MAQSLTQFTDNMVTAMVDNSRYPQLAGEPMPDSMRDEMTNSMSRLSSVIWDMVAGWSLGLEGGEFTDQRVAMTSSDDFPSYLADKIDLDTIRYNDINKLYVYQSPVASFTIRGGAKIGIEPYLYMQNDYLRVNVDDSTDLTGGDDTLPNSSAVKSYITNTLSSIGGAGGIGDMIASVYDHNLDGVVNDSDKLAGLPPSYYLDWGNLTNIPPIASLSNEAINRVAIMDGASGLTGYSGLTFDGTTLKINQITDTNNSSGVTIENINFNDGFINFPSGAILTPEDAVGANIIFSAYDTDTSAPFQFAVLTSAPTPTFDLSTSVTVGTNPIAYSTGAFHNTFSDYVSDEHIDHTTVTLTINGTSNEIGVTGGAQDITTNRTWTIGLVDNPIIPGTGAMVLPIGSTASRPVSLSPGMVRYNIDNHTLEYYNLTTWVQVVNWSNTSANISTTGDITANHLFINYIQQNASNGVNIEGTVFDSGTLGPADSPGETSFISVYNTDTSSPVIFATLTSASTPVVDLGSAVTIGGNDIAYNGGTFHDTFSDFVANEHIDHTSVSLTISATTNETSVTGGSQDISANRTWTVGLADNPVIPGIESLTLPIGSTGNRPVSTSPGMIRFNTQLDQLEYFDNSAWKTPLVDGATLTNLSFTDGIYTNRVYERTSGTGVTIDSMLIKDGFAAPHVKRSEWDQNGFMDPDSVVIIWNDFTRELSIQPAGSNFEYYIGGYKYLESGTITKSIGTTSGLYVFYFSDEGVISTVLNPTHSQVDDVIKNNCIIAYVYWNNTLGDGRMMRELHGANMAPDTHHWLHDNMSAQYSTGMSPGNMVVDGNGSSDSHAQFSIEAGGFYDEDIYNSLPSITSTVGTEIWYRDSGVWRWTTNPGFHVINTGSGLLGYDNLGILTEAGNNKFVLGHLFATNIVDGDSYPNDLKYISVIGHGEYDTLTEARDAAETEINQIVFAEIPVQEIIPVATFIYQTKTTYTNSVKAAILSTVSGAEFVDWRKRTLSGGTGLINDHGTISGLGDDDHIQYALLSGRSGDILNIDQIDDFSGNGVTIEGINFNDSFINFPSGSFITPGDSLGSALILAAYDTDTSTPFQFGVLTSDSTPTFNLDISVTIGGNSIAYSGGAFHDGFSDYVANEHIDWTNTSQNINTSGSITATSMVTNNISEANLGSGVSVENVGFSSGVITSGTWQGNSITDGYISSASTWNSKQDGSPNLTSLSGLVYSGLTNEYFIKMRAANDFILDGNEYALTTHDHSGVYSPVGHSHSNLTAGLGISGSTYDGTAAVTFALDFTEPTQLLTIDTADIFVFHDSSAGTLKQIPFSNLQSQVLNGNALSATTLQTARTFTIGATGRSFDGSASVSWTLGDIGAQASNSILTALTSIDGSGTGFVKFNDTGDTFFVDQTSYEPAFTKNTAFNKNFGTIAGTVAEGNHTHSGYQTSSPILDQLILLAGNGDGFVKFNDTGDTFFVDQSTYALDDHTHTAANITDFDTEVANNTTVAANTTHRTSNGTDHSYINQSVTTAASPNFENLDINSGNNKGIRFWGGTSSYSIVMSAVSGDLVSTLLDDSGDYNMYFSMSAGTSRGFVFHNPTFSSTAMAQITDGYIWAKEGFKTQANSGSLLLASDGSTVSTSSFQPVGSYNTIIGTDTDLSLTGATVISGLTLTDGVITAHDTRDLTAADIGAATSSHSHSTLSGLVKIVAGGTQLQLNAGESDSYDSGQTSERIYLNAENGIEISSSPDNWGSSWAGRNTAIIAASDASSQLPGNLTLNNGGNLVVGGTISASGYNDTNWNSAYSERRQWDGGSTNLNASTARTSLGLTGTVTTHNHDGTYLTVSGTAAKVTTTASDSTNVFQILADNNDSVIYANNSRLYMQPSTGDLYSAGNITANTLTIDGILLEDSADRTGLLEVNRKGTTAWAGVEIVFSSTAQWSMMGDQDTFGWYDDYNGNWIIQYDENAATALYYNGDQKLYTQNGGVNITGTLTVSGNITGYSDMRGKVLIDLVDTKDVLDKYDLLTPIIYKYKYPDKHSLADRQIGFSAQDLYDVFPEATSYDSQEDKWGINVLTLASLNASAIIGVKSEIDILRDRVKELEDKLSKYENAS